MKLRQLVLEGDRTFKDFEDWKSQVRSIWGSSVIIKKISDDKVIEFWVAKKPEDWKEYPNDASMRVATFKLIRGKQDKDISQLWTQDELDSHRREAAARSKNVKLQNAKERKVATKLKTDFFIGQRVKLIADEDEGWDEETGEIVRIRKLDRNVIVVVDKKFRDGADDDGIREVDFNQIVPLVKKPPK